MTEKERILNFVSEWRRHPEWKTFCFYCGVRMEEAADKKNPLARSKEHIIPQSSRRRCRSLSVVRACHSCNCSRGDMTLDRFRVRKNLKEFYAETVLGKRITGRPELKDMLEYEVQVFSSRIGNIIWEFGQRGKQ